MARLTLFWWAFTYIWTTWAILDDWLWRIAAIGAAILALGTIWKKGIVPTVVFFKRMSTGLDALFDLKDWQTKWSEDTTLWRQKMEDRVEAIESHLDADVVIRTEVGPPRPGPAGIQGPVGETGATGPKGDPGP